MNNDSLTDTDLDVIETRVNAAIGGPYEVRHDHAYHKSLLILTHNRDADCSGVGREIADSEPYTWGNAPSECRHPADIVATMEFFVHARTEMPALLLELRRSRELLRQLKATEPIAYSDVDDKNICIYCGDCSINWYDSLTHNPDCPWLLARQYIDDISKSTLTRE